MYGIEHFVSKRERSFHADHIEEYLNDIKIEMWNRIPSSQIPSGRFRWVYFGCDKHQTRTVYQSLKDIPEDQSILIRLEVVVL